MSEPGTLGGSFDQTRDIGKHRLTVFRFDRAENRRDRREGIVGDLRICPGKPCQQRRLTCVRQPHQPSIGQQFQLHLYPVGLPRIPFLGEAGRLPRRGGEPLVPTPPTPPVSDNGPLPSLHQVDPTPIHSFRLSPSRHRNLTIVSASPMLIGPFPMLPAPSPKVLAPPQRPQVALRGIADQHDIPAMPPVSAVRPTTRNMRLPTKRNSAIPTGTALNPDFGLVVHGIETIQRQNCNFCAAAPKGTISLNTFGVPPSGGAPPPPDAGPDMAKRGWRVRLPPGAL